MRAGRSTRVAPVQRVRRGAAVTVAEQSFLLRLSRLVVGRYGLELSFERADGLWRLWVQHPYGVCAASLDVAVAADGQVTSAFGNPLHYCDVATQLRTRLRSRAS